MNINDAKEYVLPMNCPKCNNEYNILGIKNFTTDVVEFKCINFDCRKGFVEITDNITDESSYTCEYCDKLMIPINTEKLYDITNYVIQCNICYDNFNESMCNNEKLSWNVLRSIDFMDHDNGCINNEGKYFCIKEAKTSQ